ncbi:MAG TPA: hypothetical protein VFQ39_10040, partial [Longimicrobium sp.]|nr:hypothetical protein [Longimicrobium sp.]
MNRRPAPVAAALAAAFLLPAAAAAQRDTAVAAGARYRAGGVHEFLLGSDWRDVWTTPARIPFLDLSTTAGGLTPTEKGGGNQTRSLRFRGGDGREYAFRSIDKDQLRGAHPDVRGTLAGDVIQDQVSSLLPWSSLVANRLADAAGVPHVPAAAYVMPDDPRLGEFRAEFAGMLGYLEERPKTGATGIAALAAADEIADTDEMLAALDSSAARRVAAREYLAGRLLDLLFNDWDRHEDQYYWARFGQLWRPVPRDRDYAFVDYEGFAVGLARSRVPRALRFQPSFRGQLKGLALSAAPLDRRLLTALPRPVFDSAATALRARLTDAVIDDAVRSIPSEHLPLVAEEMARVLRARRDRLGQIADELYLLHNREAEVRGRALAESAEAVRLPDGSVEVRVSAAGATEPLFVRRFLPAETREVRLFLEGGDDEARVSGAGREGIVVRVIGGAGDDVFRDETRSGARVAFYDHEGENRAETRPGTTVDRREWVDPDYEPGQGRPPRADWGLSTSFTSPYFGWRGQAGPVAGVGMTRTRRGFRRFPYATDQALHLLYAPLHGRWGVEYTADRRFVGSENRFELLARASEIEATGFRGFGNDTPEPDDADDRRIFERQLLVEPRFTWVRPGGAELWLGGTLRHTEPDVPAGSPADLFGGRGTERFAVGGARAGLRFDRADSDAFPTRGWTAEVEGGAFAPIDGEVGSFA